MRAHGLLSALALSAVLALTSCSTPTPPPVSDKVQQYYDANKSLGAQESDPLPVVVFIGDSYSAGTGASKGMGFADLLAKDFKAISKNLALGGTGYVKRIDTGGSGACGTDICASYLEVANKVISAQPDVVIVSGGRNDNADAETIENGTKALFDKLRAGLPDAQIIATSPVWGAEPPPANSEPMRAAVESAVTAAGGTFVDVGNPFEGHPELITGDGVHPNDAGHRKLYETVKAALPPMDVLK